MLKVNILSSIPAHTPCAPNSRLIPTEGSLLSNPHDYRSLVGSLHYLTFIRPDLSFVVQQVCRFMSAPIDVHLVATKRILRYVNGSLHQGIFLQPGSLSISAFSDSDWAEDPFDRRSIASYIVYLGSNPITWCAKKQDTVSKSSTEVEYKALATTANELS